MAWVDRKIIALCDDVDDMLKIAEVEIRVDALGVEVQGEIDEIDVAGTFAVSEQTALDPVATSKESKFGSSNSSTCSKDSVLQTLLECNGRHKPRSL